MALEWGHENSQKGHHNKRPEAETSDCTVLGSFWNIRNRGEATTAEPRRVGRNASNTSNNAGDRSVKSGADYATYKAYGVSHKGVGIAEFSGGDGS